MDSVLPMNLVLLVDSVLSMDSVLPVDVVLPVVLCPAHGPDRPSKAKVAFPRLPGDLKSLLLQDAQSHRCQHDGPLSLHPTGPELTQEGSGHHDISTRCVLEPMGQTLRVASQQQQQTVWAHLHGSLQRTADELALTRRSVDIYHSDGRSPLI